MHREGNWEERMYGKFQKTIRWSRIVMKPQGVSCL
jgi:hypothetical protein